MMAGAAVSAVALAGSPTKSIVVAFESMIRRASGVQSLVPTTWYANDPATGISSSSSMVT
jgi:hypothetical protein